jgi:hypothetical protein
MPRGIAGHALESVNPEHVVMSARLPKPIALTRRAALLLPFLAAGCGDDEPKIFPPLRFKYLQPIRLNVADIVVEQRFVPAGVPPDVSTLDPVRPIDALKAMADDRLQAFGAAGRAVFIIQDASLTRSGDVISGSMAVLLDVYTSDNVRAGFAEARVALRHTGKVDDLRTTLYDMTKAMMDDMNVEFEYQVRRNLKDWLTTPTAVSAPVDQAPLDEPAPPGAPEAR